MTFGESIPKLQALLASSVQKIAIVTHVNPDGDAIGSSLGLNRILQNAGFHSSVIFPTNFPAVMTGLPRFRSWTVYEQQQELSERILKEADLIFCLDFNDVRRSGKVGSYMSSLVKPVVLIDHHPYPQIAANFSFSETAVSSTSELVYRFVHAMDWQNYLDGLASDALLTGIIADTASFAHNASRPELYEAVSGLIALGADQIKIQEALFNTNSEDRLRLLGYTLSEKMIILPEYHTAILSLSRAELLSFNFKMGDTEGFVNYPLSIEGIVFSVLFLENEDKVKISFRSKGGFAVNELSSTHFSGGGHLNAAGGEAREPLAVAIERFKGILPDYKNQLTVEYTKLNVG
ncbi:MAG: DHH family phosphoesterase [Marinilabiliales bacterium]|nr:DHH family phosphoesterase [Marinilabiliales bacterium]